MPDNPIYKTVLNKVIEEPTCAYYLISNNVINVNSPDAKKVIQAIAKESFYAYQLILLVREKNNSILSNPEYFQIILKSAIQDANFACNLIRHGILQYLFQTNTIPNNPEYFQMTLNQALADPLNARIIISSNNMHPESIYFEQVLKKAVEDPSNAYDLLHYNLIPIQYEKYYLIALKAAIIIPIYAYRLIENVPHKFKHLPESHAIKYLIKEHFINIEEASDLIRPSNKNNYLQSIKNMFVK